ncbi:MULTISPECIES: IPExxxVDY family protein [Zobellia]|uniref:IPExxxVDY family protein n=1 Tax=Zobellia TaxID=112040 RepID=UPI001BFF66DE|nr:MULTISPECIES: IPExxxVDY family protein [Zobellia]MBT9187083.1 IPExxxVDY family protein [Zobellia russellii]MBU2975048.1 IPExxxVDY family protein [Zobellia sp. B3R18]MDO6818034.1 IPExxxVDY family protein [Zobellia sp. 1_MG-2023]
MVAVHKITNDFYEDTFDLVALHSSLEDYAIAYALNLHLKSSFKRSPKDLDLTGHITVPIFEWKDDINDRYWTLFTNNGLAEDTNSRKGLFKDEPSFTTFHMVPEHRDVDYFLKIEQDGFINMENLVRTLQNIPKIITAYAIETDKLKSKNNLIF